MKTTPPDEDLEKEIEEAAHDFSISDIIKGLGDRDFRIFKCGANFMLPKFKSMDEEINRLKAKNEGLENALKYYADERNWDKQDTFGGRISLKEENDDTYLVGFEQDDSEEVGGRRAFEALRTQSSEYKA